VSIAAGLLADDASLLPPEEVSKLANTIQACARWLQATTDSLLTTAAIEEGHLRIERAAVMLPDVLRDVLPVIEPLLASRGQWLRVRRRGRPQKVLADRQRIGQVMLNLISNASKYGPPSAPIDLTLEARAGTIRITVADRGPGVPVETQRRIFAPFFRTESARSTKTTGIGLGLAIVKAIVKAHQGQVGVRNRVGGGARFWFELPAHDGLPVTFPRTEARPRQKTG
jgi:signal transduction histidine kinase